MIASVLEQKVWLTTSSRLFPNIYTFLVAPPGIGKSRVLNTVRQLIVDAVKEPFIAPTSVNAATVVDQMVDSKRSGIAHMKPYEYNALTILVSEFGTFMSKYEDDMVAMLTAFYDVEPYGQRRRGSGLKLAIERPLLNMMIGSTPAALLKFMPENAWEQGFTSRIIFACSDERKMVDDFAYLEHGEVPILDTSDLVADLKAINNIYGEFKVTQEYARAVKIWREEFSEQVPGTVKPSHPKLVHYLTRRKAHLYRLSMIAAVDRDSTLILDQHCFNRAMSWMVEVEAHMPMIFKTANEQSDDRAMMEIHHYVMNYNLTEKKALAEQKLIGFARQKVYAQNVLKVLDLMLHSKMLEIHSQNERTKIRFFIAKDLGAEPSPDPGQALLQ